MKKPAYMIDVHAPHTKTNPEGRAFGKLEHKNPFRGIACSNGSNYGLKYFRHVEGARDTRPSYHTRRRRQILRKIFIGEGDVAPFRDSVSQPFSFTE